MHDVFGRASQNSTAVAPPEFSNRGEVRYGSMVVNEILFFVHNKFDCMPKADIRSTIADFFREDEIDPSTVCEAGTLSAYGFQFVSD